MNEIGLRYYQNLRSLLLRYEFELSVENEIYRICKISKRTSFVNSYLMIASMLSILGIIGFFYISILIGAIIMSSSIPLFIKAFNIKFRELEVQSKFVELSGEIFTIQNGDNREEITTESIDSISFSFEKGSDISIGTIYLNQDTGDCYELIELYGNDPRYLEDDIEKLADKITEIANR